MLFHWGLHVKTNNALQQHGLASAGQGMDHMDWGTGFPDRLQDAALLFVCQNHGPQRTGQSVNMAITEEVPEGVTVQVWLGRGVPSNSRAHRGRAEDQAILQRSVQSAVQADKGRNCRAGVIEDDHDGLPELKGGRFKDHAALPSQRAWCRPQVVERPRCPNLVCACTWLCHEVLEGPPTSQAKPSNASK